MIEEINMSLALKLSKTRKILNAFAKNIRVVNGSTLIIELDKVNNIDFETIMDWYEDTEKTNVLDKKANLIQFLTQKLNIKNNRFWDLDVKTLSEIAKVLGYEN